MRPRERLLRKGINPNEENAIRKALEDWSDRLSLIDHIFTGAVVAGLIIEYLPEVTSVVSSAIAAVLRRYDLQLREWGGLFVIIGVAGELWIGVRSSAVETELRNESERELSQLNMEAAAARERVTVAERLLVDLRLEQMPRSSVFDFRKFAGALQRSEFKGSLEIMYTPDPEAQTFASNLGDCFAIGGWNILHPPIPAPGNSDVPELPGILLAGGGLRGIALRAGTAISDQPVKTVVDAFNSVADTRGKQFVPIATTSKQLTEDRVRLIVCPKF